MFITHVVEKPDITVIEMPMDDLVVIVRESGSQDRFEFRLDYKAARQLARNLDDACEHAAASARVVEVAK
jgi:hypothetical protein